LMVRRRLRKIRGDTPVYTRLILLEVEAVKTKINGSISNHDQLHAKFGMLAKP
jgi:hypothetical protein